MLSSLLNIEYALVDAEAYPCATLCFSMVWGCFDSSVLLSSFLFVVVRMFFPNFKQAICFRLFVQFRNEAAIAQSALCCDMEKIPRLACFLMLCSSCNQAITLLLLRTSSPTRPSSLHPVLSKLKKRSSHFLFLCAELP